MRLTVSWHASLHPAVFNRILLLLDWAIVLTQGPREQQLALPLLLLLGQQLRVIALQTESPHLKLVAELYDKASQTLLQACLPEVWF